MPHSCSLPGEGTLELVCSDQTSPLLSRAVSPTASRTFPLGIPHNQTQLLIGPLSPHLNPHEASIPHLQKQNSDIRAARTVHNSNPYHVGLFDFFSFTPSLRQSISHRTIYQVCTELHTWPGLLIQMCIFLLPGAPSQVNRVIQTYPQDAQTHASVTAVFIDRGQFK